MVEEKKRKKRLLIRYKEELNRLENLPFAERVDKMNKIQFFKQLISKTEKYVR